ncbi:hypothetical protein AIOL_004059 [Candidatus Rhodobacter oscarellae]|uniref:Aspartyl-trna synthetase n=1 Tax=Candidatus Rhodobacter oscarellae TaxID=1675527 RepID=A0A0J9H007_9RHOB|nr:SH3 domain-containing protein [Candidatus Rhodobacter lobularis]KMW59078.1 hypothetical protein AIOL_004059 [Candidatus Rhodobacter lobularis]
MGLSRFNTAFLGVVAAALVLGAPGLAGERGPVTNLPMPRFVSLKASEGNVRRGPSLGHRIDWVFKRRNMPLEITGEYGHWRRVQDRDGAGGWMHYSLLSGTRTVIVETDMLPILMKPDPNAPVNAQVEIGVIAQLDNCVVDWCRIRAERYRGWVPRKALWGVDSVETLE